MSRLADSMPAQLARVLVQSITNRETTRIVLIASYGDGHGDLVYMRGPNAAMGGARLMAKAASTLIDRLAGEALADLMGEMMTRPTPEPDCGDPSCPLHHGVARDAEMDALHTASERRFATDGEDDDGDGDDVDESEDE